MVHYIWRPKGIARKETCYPLSPGWVPPAQNPGREAQQEGPGYQGITERTKKDTIMLPTSGGGVGFVPQHKDPSFRFQTLIEVQVFANGERLEPVQFVKGFDAHKNGLVSIGHIESPRPEVGQVGNQTQRFLRRDDSKTIGSTCQSPLIHYGLHFAIASRIQDGIRM